MTETDIPLLGPGRDLTQAASQTVMTIGSALRERRFALGRHAWSDDRTAERVVEGHRRAADPPVREMNDAEADLFRREGGAGRPGYETRQTSGSHGDVRVTVGPMPEGRGWGLVAEAAAPRGAESGQSGPAPSPARAWVVAKSETDVKELADELLAGGHPRVQRLHEFGQYAARRATQARTEVRETREQLIQRTADVVRHVWRTEPDLAERMIQPAPADVQEGKTTNGALGALAHELEKLEDRGYDMADVLTRVDRTHALRGARNPAAMACSFVQRLAPDLQVINLDDQTEPERGRTADGHATNLATGPRTRAAGRPGPPAESVTAAQEALDTALQSAELPAEAVRSARGYPRLETLLAEQHAQGRDLDTLLSQLPTRRLAGADDPAAYLRAVVESRLSADPLRKTRPGLHSAAEFVERCLPRDASRAVTACESWPGLAARLSQWRSEGLPFTTMLESLPADRIRTATRPAHFAGVVLNAKAATYRDRKQHAPETGTDRRTVDPDWPAGPEPTPEPHHAQTQAPAPEAATTVIDMGPSPTAIPLPPASVDQLDPDSAVDRVALQAARGTGNAEQDAAIERLLTTSSRATGQPAVADAASAYAESERDRADVADRDAAHAASTPDDLSTAEREDLAGHEHAHAADGDADQARAVADSDSEVAAAARAELSYRAREVTSTDGPRTPSPSPAPAPRRAPARPVTPTQQPVRTLRRRR